MGHKVFINLPVKNLERSLQFFKGLGFAFNPQFTDEKAGCMLISEEAFAMLLSESFFKTFTTREVCDTKTHFECAVALSCDSREQVDAMVDKALALGAVEPTPPTDYGFMFQRSFADLDGHQWEVMWMNPDHLQKQSASATPDHATP